MADAWGSTSSTHASSGAHRRPRRATGDAFVVRWFSVPELRAWLEEAGFENVRAPGVTKDSRLVVVAERA
jgi:hypothetical protein